jgi:hypothetical protein
VFLVALHSDGNQAGTLESLEFPLHRSPARPGEFHHLSDEKTSVGLPKQEAQNPLLR